MILGWIRSIAGIGLAIGIFMTFAGVLAPVLPSVDLFNNLRVLTALGFAGLAAFAAVSRMWRITAWSVALLLVNGALSLTPILTHAKAAKSQSNNRIEVISFNVAHQNLEPGRAARWLSKQTADIVVLQETFGVKDLYKAALKSRFPYVYDCDCNSLLVFSRRRWLEAKALPRTENTPPVIMLRFSTKDGKPYRFVGLHMDYPFEPSRQHRHYQWAEKQFSQPEMSTILAGDLNLTPWSWKLQRLSWSTGMVRHGMWARSWNGSSVLLPALVLIDNVLTTPDIRTVAFKTGPPLGSDHLPIMVTLAMP